MMQMNGEHRKKLYGQKKMLPMMILEILQDLGDPEVGIPQKKMAEILKNEYGTDVSRNTLRQWLEDLEDAGFSIEKTHSGVQYYGRAFADGELLQVIDQIRSNPFLIENQKNDIIRQLVNYGTPSFKKNMTGYLQFKNDNRYPHVNTIPNSVSPADITESVELIQKAIFADQRVSFNYYSFIYEDGIQTIKVYSEPIKVNPFGLVYKGGKYCLVGSLPDSQKVEIWKVEKICDLTALTEGRDRIPATISAHGGVNGYAEMQPELRGGSIEHFRIQCSPNDIDDIVDIFGTSLRETPVEKNKRRNPGVLVLDVYTTREAMRSWALANAEKVSVIEPKDFYEDIMEILSKASRTYRYAERTRENPLHQRMEESHKHFRELMETKTFEERVKTSTKLQRRILNFGCYTREKETADLSLLKDLPDLKMLSLYNCVITNTECLSSQTELKRILLTACEYDADVLAASVHPEIFETDSIAAAKIVASVNELSALILYHSNVKSLADLKGIKPITRLELRGLSRLRDASVLGEDPAFKHLTEIIIRNCPALTDFSFMKKLPDLKRVSFHDLSFDLEDALKLKAETGIEKIEIRGMESLDEESLKKLGVWEEVSRRLQIRSKFQELRNKRLRNEDQ